MIRRRRAPIATKTGHERWLVSYSDLVTLLFAFFVMMYSVSQVNEQKYRVLSSTLASAFGDPAATNLPAQASPSSTITSLERGQISPGQTSSQALGRQLQSALAGLLSTQAITIRAAAEWVEIDVDANLLFDSASAQPSAQARQVFARVAQVLGDLDNPIEVAGHTDDLPISTAEFASNWELSAARAAAAVRLLAAGGVHPARLSAVGYGEHRPQDTNQTPEGRANNRRVVLKVMSRVEKSPVIDGDSPMQSWPVAMDRPPLTNIASPAAPQNTAEAEPSSPPVDPVRLDHGGLLFSSDPKLPRNTR